MKNNFIEDKLNKDFYDNLPSSICEGLDNSIAKYGNKEWFITAWNEYRNHVFENDFNTLKTPGYIFNKYISNESEMSHDGLAYDYLSEDELIHYGTPRHSGRYPWGSGDNPYQHTGDFYTYVNKMKAQGFSEKEIADSMGLSTTVYRDLYTIDKNNRRRDMIAYAKSAELDGKSRVQIGKELGEKYNDDKSPIGESTVRSLLNADSEARMNISQQTAENLKKIVEEKGILDVGIGVEREIGISRNKLDTAIELLRMEGYEVYSVRVPQATNKGKYTTVKTLAKPGTEYKEIYNFEDIGHLSDYTSPDDGNTLLPSFQYPKSLDSKRLMIRYSEDGGTNKDGVIEIRRNVDDLSLGESNYAQVRILVDDKYYLKGMAVYSDGSDMPDGVDVIFNSNKSKDVGMEGALKSVSKNLKKDPDNPFGSSIKEGFGPHGGQSYYLDKNGEYQLSLINKRSDEGDWGEWSKEIPSQMLSKQPLKLIKRQLDLATVSKEEELDQILEVTNPSIKREMLLEFADKCDKAAVDLKAAPFPGQKYQVILPLTTIKDDEIYAPNYPDGSELALIRYPHGGTFEIPIVKVNNRNREGKEVITPNGLDAVGISSRTAQRLSGADFDGDTVMVIPMSDKVRITSTDPLKGLVGFDPSLAYGPDPKESYTDSSGKEHYIRNGIEYKQMNNTQTEMGKISNLITDMTLKGADEDEIARAVRHSMVVIDAEKHHLDYKQSEIDNGIKALHKKYQTQVDPETGKVHQGASTLISKAKSPAIINERKEDAYVSNETGNILTKIDDDKGLYLDEKTGKVYQSYEKHNQKIDPKTGKLLYHETGAIYKDVEYKDSEGKKQRSRLIEKDGKMLYKNKEGKYVEVTTENIVPKRVTQESTKMAETDDAFTLSSGKPQETAYAIYANKMKALANKARLESLKVEDIPYSKSARVVYQEEVDSLNVKLNESLSNAPKERHAQMIAASQLQAIKQDNPRMTSEEETKIATRLLSKARARVGAKRKEITISDKEWEAIQAGAIAPTRLKQIFRFADSSRIKQLATPRNNNNTMSKTQVNRMKSLSNKGYTNEEIAKALGVSVTTVVKYLAGKE